MKLKRQFDNKFHNLLDELMKAWENNDVRRFMTINHHLAILVTDKAQELINTKHPTLTFDFETNETEAKLVRLNTLLDSAIDKKNNLLKASDWEEKKEK